MVGGRWSNGATLVIRASAEVWDPATDSVSPAGTLARERYDHTATLLPDGRVLVAGGSSGRDPDVAPIASLEVWDPRTSTFSPAGQLRTARSGHAALLLGDARVLIVGETDTELWDPTTGTVMPGPSLVEPRYFHTATLLQDGRVLVTGGMWGSNADIVVRASAEVWDPRHELVRAPRQRAHRPGQSDGDVALGRASPHRWRRRCADGRGLGPKHWYVLGDRADHRGALRSDRDAARRRSCPDRGAP